MKMLFSVVLYSVHIILPFMAIMIAYCCLRSLFGNLSAKRPLIALFNKTTNQKIPIVYWENSIGRDKHCDVVVDSPTASRDHAVLFRRDNGWIIADTNSRGGVMLNGNAVKEPQVVCVDDVIEIGGMEYELKKADILPEVRNSKKKAISAQKFSAGGGVLALVSVFQFLAAAELCFAGSGINFKPMLIAALLFGVSWIYYFVAKYGLGKINFELETLGIFLSGTGIITSCGVDVSQTYTQLAALAVGLIFFSVMAAFIHNPDFAMKWRPYIAALAIILLLLNLVFGKVKHGSQNWIMVGPVSIQPSELVKVAFVFFGSSTLCGIQTTKNLTWFIAFSAVCMGALFVMGDFGTACIFFVTFILISFMRSGSVRTVILTCSAAVLGVALILKFKPYIVDRFSAWRHVWEHVNDTGFQQTRVLAYSGSGGLFGMGIGKGCLKYVFAAPSDLVFGMLCEEWGLILALTVIMIIAMIAVYARKASIRSRSAFYSIASCCAGGMMVFQMIMNVFGVVDILPLTGVTLPFVSLGGSSMIATWGLLAFIKASDERTYALKR